MLTCLSRNRLVSCCLALLGSFGALVLFLVLLQVAPTTSTASHTAPGATSAGTFDAVENVTEVSVSNALASTCYARIAGSLSFTFTNVQAAVDAANEGDTVMVAGTCAGVQGRAGVTQTVYISKNITLRGGYTTTNWAVPNPETNPTTLDAMYQGRVLYVTGDISVTIEGLRITRGDLEGGAGGGVYAITATLTVSDSQILGNSASYGGGLCFRNSPNATLIGNTIRDNAAGTGGGAVFNNSPGAWLSENTISANRGYPLDGGVLFANSPSATLTGNIISENRVFRSTKEAHHGGVSFSDSDGATLIGNTISGNIAPDWCGGLCFIESDNVTLIDNTISGNIAGEPGRIGRGGGLYFVGGSEINLVGNTISDNWSSDVGGGFYLYGTDVTLTNNVIFNNKADRAGGGLNLYRGDIILTNNVIADNLTNGSGSALYAWYSSPQLLHNTIVRNSGGDGSGIYVTNNGPGYYSSVTLTNTILVSHAVGISVTAGNTATLEATLWDVAACASGTDWGGAGLVITGDINLCGNPAFVNPNAGDYHIRLNSAARDAGLNAGVRTDIDGVTRPQAVGYDIGADEWGVSTIYLPLVMRQWPPIPDIPSLDPIDNSDCDSDYTINWAAASRATYYNLEEAQDSINFSRIYSGTANTSHTVCRRGPGHCYYRVKACNQWGCSGWSSVEDVKVWWENGPNDGLDQANGPLLPFVNYYGYPDDHWDYFKIAVQEAGLIVVDLISHNGQGVQLQLKDQTGKRLVYDYTPPYHIEHTGPAGQYYVYIYTESGCNNNTPYTLRVKFSSQVALNTFHGRYVTAMDDQEKDGGGYWDWELRAETQATSHWEVFTLIWLGDDTIALKTHHGKYAAAMDKSQDYVIKAKNTNPSACTEFELKRQSDNTVAFKTCHDRHVSAREGNEDWLLKQVEALWGWEAFALVSPPPSQR